MCKKGWLPMSNVLDPASRTPTMPSQASIFRHRPACQAQVEMHQYSGKCRFMVTTIVHNPTANDRVEYFGQIVDAFVNTTVELPVSHCLTDGFRGSTAHAWTEVDEGLPIGSSPVSAERYSQVSRTSGSGIAPVARYPCNTQSASCLDATRVRIQQNAARVPLAAFEPDAHCCSDKWHHRQSVRTVHQDGVWPSTDRRHNAKRG